MFKALAICQNQRQKAMLHCDEGQTLELSALKLFMLANLH